jgi:dimeric dUTPase (all-alpha-NTP-PPase superfamily)
MLDKMLQKQKELQERLGYDFGSMTREEITAYIKEFSIHLTQELHEMLYSLPYFKPWKDYSAMTVEEYETSMEEARKEFIDVFHFMLNIALALGMSDKDIYDMYMEKNKENHKRQDEGYTYDKSYR